MKIDLSKKLMSLEGKAVVNLEPNPKYKRATCPNCNEPIEGFSQDKKEKPYLEKDLTIQTLIVNALMGDVCKEEDDTTPISGEEKIQRLAISLRIEKNAKKVDLEIDDVKLIDQFCDKIYKKPLLYARIHEALNA